MSWVSPVMTLVLNQRHHRETISNNELCGETPDYNHTSMLIRLSVQGFGETGIHQTRVTFYALHSQ